MVIEDNAVLSGRYRLIRRVGRGSFGEVWLARDEQVDIEVAVKIYVALDNQGILDFKSEFSSTYQLNHPNLLHASYFDICDSRPYLVMPFCPGSAMALIGTSDENEVWHFIRDTASGLEYLHSQDIVHRDIKPDNVLKSRSGSYLITDFGISVKMRSTLLRNSTKSNESTSTAGTIAYMGPELFSNESHAVKASDIWALGVSIFEIVEGELPFAAQGGVMLMHGADIPNVHGKWSENLRSVITACLSKDPWDRPSASKLKEFATSVLKGENVKWKVTKKKSLLPIAIGIATVVAVAAFFIFDKVDNQPEPVVEPEPAVEQIVVPFVDDSIYVNGISLKMIAVQGGTFSMGADQDPEAKENEKPTHNVTVNSFHIGETEVTQQLWEAVMGSNPSEDKSPLYPVQMVSWNDCQKFISRLNSITGREFRLPTEAEWEFAARGGNLSKGFRYSGSDDISSVAWINANSGEHPHNVKTKAANELGIYDMSGNVFEWCSDIYMPYSGDDNSGTTLRVSRGGVFTLDAGYCRVSARNRNDPSAKYVDLGLRLAF